jgi:tetratricopeptide (TPR) repeat protein
VSGQRKALIIANDEYEQEALSNLLAPEADADALGRVLGDAQIGAFSVYVVRNQPSHVIQAHIEDLFLESRPDDLLLLHFSGHGLKSESGELFFAAANTKPNRLGSTAVSAHFVQRCMRSSRSRSVVLLLDCCYGGAFAQGVKVRVVLLPQSPTAQPLAEERRNFDTHPPREPAPASLSAEAITRQAVDNAAPQGQPEMSARLTREDNVRKTHKRADGQIWEETVRQSREAAERGESHRLMGRHDEALADLNHAIELDPNSVFAVCNRGETYRLMGRHDEALVDLNRAIELDFNYKDALYNWSETYRMMGRYDGALADLNRILELDPNYAFALASRGAVYRDEGRYDEALADLERPVQLDPTYAWANNVRRETYRLRKR